MKQSIPQFKMSLSQTLKNRLEASAQELKRTLNAEIEARLNESFELTSPTRPVRRLRDAKPQALQAALVPDALLRIGVVEQLTGLGETTIRRKMAAARFPQPIKDGARCTRWRAGEVTAWLREQGVAA
jgi:prophage regulatory protein